MEDKRVAYRFVVGDTWRKEPLGRSRRGWNGNVDNITRLGKHGLRCSDSGQKQVAGIRECGNEPLGSIKWGNFSSSWEVLASQEGLCCMYYLLTLR